jgi:KUP system potassium uptake protein
MENRDHLTKVTPAGLLVALGIIYGDIGTSPLYVLKAIIGEEGTIRQNVVYGGVSCIFLPYGLITKGREAFFLYMLW